MGSSKKHHGLVVGLDCSTTATKAIAFDRDGRAIARAAEPIALRSPQSNYYEQEADEWWSSARKALKELTRTVDPLRIKALAIANQRETFVPLSQQGKSLRPAIVWLDERCKEEVEPFARRIGKDTIHRITGKPADYAPVVYRLAWMKKHEPDLFKAIGMICEVQSFLVWKLTGTWVTSWASADPLGLFDMRRKAWAPVILAALGLTSRQLPSLCCPGTVIGRITEAVSSATGLSSSTVIVAGGGDGQAAGLGANVLSPERAYLNLGTAVVAGVYGTRYRTSRAFRTLCSCSDTGYYYECSLRAGTFGLDWLIKQVFGIDFRQQPDIHARLEQEAAGVPPGSGGLLHLPYLCGVMNPYWDMNARGAFVGLSSSQSRGHIYRSMLEGIAFEQTAAIRAVEKTIGSTVRELVAIGGGAASKLWCHLFADITGNDICLPGSTDASALGAAIAAAVGIGLFPTFAEAAGNMSGAEKTIKPDRKNRKMYAGLSETYQRIYPALKKIIP